MTQSAHSTEIDGPPDQKAVLFCPACDHQSHIEGDWIVRERATSIEYRCPDCEARITEREREQPPIARVWSAWIRAANAWFRPPRRLRA